MDYQGENFARFSGDTQEHANAQIFAWDASHRGLDVHLLAEPTKLELLKKEYDKNKDALKNNARDSIIKTYGGEEHLNVPPAPLLLAQTEEYVVYSRDGKILRGQERPVIRSKYEEDVFPNNHRSVWGSYWQAGQWGYKCCHAFIKNSYCTGESGKQAAELASAVEDKEVSQVSIREEEKAESESDAEKASHNKSSEKDSSSSSSDDSSDEDKRTKTERKINKEKKKNKKKRRKEKLRNKKKGKETDELQEALKKEEQRLKEAELLLKLGDRKRAYHSMYEVKEPTVEETEAYKIKRAREEDPMAHFAD